MNIVKQHEHELTSASRRCFNGTMVKQVTARAPAHNQRSVEAIAGRLERTRLALDLTQTEFCARCGIARNTYNQWKQGKNRPELDKAILVCDAFGLTLDWIYLGDPSCLPHQIAVKLQTPPA